MSEIIFENDIYLPDYLIQINVSELPPKILKMMPDIIPLDKSKINNSYNDKVVINN